MSEDWKNIPLCYHVTVNIDYTYLWFFHKYLSLDFYIFRSLNNLEEELQYHCDAFVRNASLIYQIGGSVDLNYVADPVKEEDLPFDPSNKQERDHEELNKYWYKITEFQRQLG